MSYQRKTLNQTRSPYDDEQMEDAETADSPKRPSAMKFLNNNDSKDELNYDSDCENLPNRLHSGLRAHSPSPIRKRGSLLDLFGTPSNNGQMAMTHNGLMGTEV